jgi:hypothetical protein
MAIVNKGGNNVKNWTLENCTKWAPKNRRGPSTGLIKFTENMD